MAARDVNALKPDQAAPTGWRDVPFAVIFILNVLVIILLMAILGVKTLIKEESNTVDSLFTKKDAYVVVGVAIGLCVIAVVISFIMAKLLVAFADCMVRFTLWFNLFISIAICAFGFASGNFFLGAVGLFIVMMTLCYIRAVRHRIPFAVANLKVAAAAINKHRSTYAVAFFFTVVQVAWVFIWSLAILGVMEKVTKNETNQRKVNGEACLFNSDCQSRRCLSEICSSSSSNVITNASSITYIVFFVLLFCFYWGLQVFKNIAHTTTAGTVATWWYNAESSGATGSSLKRACTTSLGSICFGSLIVAFIQTLRAMADQARGQGSALACIAACILACLQSIVEYINKWAYIYVGIYGYKFTQAGKAVFELFHQRGFDAIINDNLIGNVLAFGALAVGLLCAGLGVLAAHVIKSISFNNAEVVLGIIGFIIGTGVAITPLSVIDSSVGTVFVCFAEDPASFQQSHPEHYAPLVTEWHRLYPQIMVASGYWPA